jgi:hypothetical protein
MANSLSNEGKDEEFSCSWLSDTSAFKCKMLNIGNYATGLHRAYRHILFGQKSVL